MNKLIIAFVLAVCFCLQTSFAVMDEFVEEYNVALIPDEKCTSEASILNEAIASYMPKLENVPNQFHVSLYTGAYRAADLPRVIDTIKSLHFRSLPMLFGKLYATDDRWVDWKVEKAPLLQLLHEEVVKALSPFHARPLHREETMYDKLDVTQQAQVQHYGAHGLMELYTPHMTLFYAYPPNRLLRTIPALVNQVPYKNLTCRAKYLVLGKSGYNGNLYFIVYTIAL